MQIKIVDSRPWYDENKTTIGTVYTVCCEDENGTEFVEVNVRGDDDSLKEQFGKSYDVNTYGDAPDFTKIDDDGADRLKKRHATPPEAYAAFIRLYIEWMEMSEDEQVDYTRKNVVYAGYNQKRFVKSAAGIIFRKSGDEMYGEEFDGYVSEAWASLGERFTDVDAFAIYLERNYHRYSTFPMSGDMLRRAAQNMMNKMRKDPAKRSDMASFDDKKQDDDGDSVDLANTISDETVSVESTVLRKEDISYEDFVKLVRKNITNPRRLQIFDLLMTRPKPKQNQIAKTLGISKPAVSNHVKEIGEIITYVSVNLT